LLGIMLQMSVGKGHTINIPGVEDALKRGMFKSWEKRHPTEPLRFIFVVDPNTYDQYQGDQTFRYEYPKRSAENTREENDIEVSQYVLKIEFVEGYDGEARDGIEIRKCAEAQENA